MCFPACGVRVFVCVLRMVCVSFLRASHYLFNEPVACVFDICFACAFCVWFVCHFCAFPIACLMNLLCVICVRFAYGLRIILCSFHDRFNEPVARVFYIFFVCVCVLCMVGVSSLCSFQYLFYEGGVCIFLHLLCV